VPNFFYTLLVYFGICLHICYQPLCSPRIIPGEMDSTACAIKTTLLIILIASNLMSFRTLDFIPRRRVSHKRLDSGLLSQRITTGGWMNSWKKKPMPLFERISCHTDFWKPKDGVGYLVSKVSGINYTMAVPGFQQFLKRDMFELCP
jgi:hypothetical protein